MDKEMMRALEADAKKLLQLTGEEHGPFCPRCLVGRTDPGLLGSPEEGNICGECWIEDREKDGPEIPVVR